MKKYFTRRQFKNAQNIWAAFLGFADCFAPHIFECGRRKFFRVFRWTGYILLIAVFGLFAPSAHAVNIQEVTAPKSGLKAWLVEDHTLPIVALYLAFEGGSEQDPADKQGLAELTMDALTEGAGTLTANEFQQQLADHSISLKFAAGRDALEGEVKFLSADKQKAVELLRAALTKPHFDNKDIERLRNRQLVAVKQQVADPSWQARYALFSHIYNGHPYGQRHLGSLQSIKSLTREDVRNFAAHHLAQDNLIVAVAGDIKAADLAALLDKTVADLPAHAVLTPVVDVQDMPNFPHILVKREGTQSELLFALPGPKRDDPDWYAAEIANYILGGGGFSSRLMQNVRDKKGLTYGIQTGLAASEHNGLWLGQAAVDNPKVGEALAVIDDTMRHFYEDGVSAREITAAKDFLTGSQPLGLTSTDKIAAMMVSMQREKLGRDYLDRYGEIMRGVSDADIQHVIETWFNPAKMVLVMVGKPDGIPAAQTQEMVRQ